MHVAFFKLQRNQRRIENMKLINNQWKIKQVSFSRYIYTTNNERYGYNSLNFYKST